MFELDQVLVRIKYALQSLDQDQQGELVDFIEYYASNCENQAYPDSKHLEIEVQDAKKLN